MKPIYCFALMMFLLNACVAKKPAAADVAIALKQENAASESAPEIVCAFFTMEQGEDGKSTILFNSKSISKGRLKDANPYLRNPNRFVKADFVNEANEVLFSMKLDHPLYPTFEYAEEQNGQLQTRTVTKEKATLMIRYQNDSRIKAVIFSEQIDTHLITIGTVDL